MSQWVTGSLGSSNDAEAGSEAGVPVSQWVTGSLDGDSGKMKGEDLEVRAFRRSREQSHASTLLGYTPGSL